MGAPLPPPHPHLILEWNLVKVWKTHPPQCPKIIFSEVSSNKLSFLLLVFLSITVCLVKEHCHLISSKAKESIQEKVTQGSTKFSVWSVKTTFILLDFPSKTYLKVYKSILIIPNLNLSETSLPNCITVVVLNKCQPGLLYALAELFIMCLKNLVFSDFWKASSAFPVFKTVWERSMSKSYCPVHTLSVFSKVFEKLVNIRILGHLENCALFLISIMV